jgi:hypothetical protein
MHPPKYTMCLQACIPALAAIHNFIWIHDPGEIDNFTYEDLDINDGQVGWLWDQPIQQRGHEQHWNVIRLCKICGRTIRVFCWGVVLLSNMDTFLCLVIFHTIYDKQECHYHVSTDMAKTTVKPKTKTKYLCIGSQMLSSWSITNAFLNHLRLSFM